jgi:UDP-2-acetamido-2,6-beta-L-arabino-hexul-4-ose reductase
MGKSHNPNSDMNIMVAGQQGFISKNLCTFFSEKKGVELLASPLTDDSIDVIIYVSKDHKLAGENKSIALGGAAMLKEIKELADKCSNFLVICGENDVEFPKDVKNILETIVVYTIPEVFGKWANASVEKNEKYLISNYCRLVINNEFIDRKNDFTLKLLYLDDLFFRLYADIRRPIKEVDGGLVEPVYQISRNALIDILEEFRESRKNLILDGVGVGLRRALYSTYISYLPPNNFAYPVSNHNDSRGRFVEVIKTSEHGQVSCFTANPGITRGEHYHHSKTEKFLVVQGKAKFQFRHLLTHETHEILTESSNPVIVESIPGWVHNVTNTGNTELIVLLWANELFDIENPDTIANEI